MERETIDAEEIGPFHRPIIGVFRPFARSEPIVWIGQRTVNCRAHPRPGPGHGVAAQIDAGRYHSEFPVEAVLDLLSGA